MEEKALKTTVTETDIQEMKKTIKKGIIKTFLFKKISPFISSRYLNNRILKTKNIYSTFSIPSLRKKRLTNEIVCIMVPKKNMIWAEHCSK